MRKGFWYSLPDRGSLLLRWVWLCPVTLAAIGLLFAILADDWLLANRSAGVLLLSFALISAAEMVTDRGVRDKR